MAWAFKTGSGANSGTATPNASVNVTLGAAVSINDRIIVLVSTWRGTTNPSISSVGDGTNSYALDQSTGVFTQDPGFPQVIAVYSANVTAGATPTVTVSGTYDACGVGVAAYSGLDTSASPVDVSVSNVATSPAPPMNFTSTATGTTTAANELVIGALGDDGQNQAYVQGTGFTKRTSRQSSVDAEVLLEDKDSGTSGTTQTALAEAGGSIPYGMMAVVYKLAGAAPPFIPHQTYMAGILTQ